MNAAIRQYLSIAALRLVMALAAVASLAACGSAGVAQYADQQPALDPQQFFEGDLTAHGVIKNRGGDVIRRFNADIRAYWKDGIGTLEEDFVFADGEESRRVWTLTPDGEGGYLGTAGDVIGAGRIELAGNSMFLEYVLRIPYGEGTIDITVDDRMYLVSPDVLINESRMKKFGFNVGEILLVIERRGSST